jgi:hypothetical protein
MFLAFDLFMGGYTFFSRLVCSTSFSSGDLEIALLVEVTSKRFNYGLFFPVLIIETNL